MRTRHLTTAVALAFLVAAAPSVADGNNKNDESDSADRLESEEVRPDQKKAEIKVRTRLQPGPADKPRRDTSAKSARYRDRSDRGHRR